MSSARANDHSESLARPRSNRYKPIISCCIAFAAPTILSLLMVIFRAITAGTPPELRLNPGSSLWSLNISTSHGKLITVEYPPMELLLSFNGQLALSLPSPVSTFTQGPSRITPVPAMARGVNSLVSMLYGGELSINVALKAQRRLRLGPWWVAVFNIEVSCTGSTFTASTNSEGGGGGDWMILGCTLNCLLDIIPHPW